MTYLIGTIAIIAHIIGMAITHGMERRRTFRPDPAVYVFWWFWLAVWLVCRVGRVVGDALRWVFTKLDYYGYRIGG